MESTTTSDNVAASHLQRGASGERKTTEALARLHSARSFNHSHCFTAEGWGSSLTPLGLRSSVEKWLGVEIEVISSKKYESVDDVFRQRTYMAGIRGAVCTTEMKKLPRFDYQRPDDIHIFGLTADEQDRIRRFEENNPELFLDWILRDNGFTKKRCLIELENAGIKLPVMYSFGFKNNNCIGCVKATSPAYWRRVRWHFPDVFNKRAVRARQIGAKLLRLNGERVFLDELPPDEIGALFGEIEEDLSCGPQCTTS